MKPTFALDLTSQVIRLLHRTPKGWLSIGEVAFDAPDLAEAIDYMRKTALGLSPLGVATKLILPNDQLLYTEVHAPGPSRDEKRRQIATALEGKTPYEVDDLVFDWSGKGATVKVAVAVRETLAEAEAFAVQHRLNPVSFVAIPESGAFVGEAWFGPSEAAAGLLMEGETVERDRDAVTILHRELPKAEDAPPTPEANPVALAVAPQALPEAASEDEALPGLEDALNADIPIVAPPLPETPGDTVDAEIETVDDEGPADFATVFASVTTESVTIPPGDAPGAVEPDELAAEPNPAEPAEDVVEGVAEVEEAPFAHVTDTMAFPETDSVPRSGIAAGTGQGGIDDDDLPPVPSSAAMLAFASRRNAAAPAGRTAGSSPALDGASRQASAASDGTAATRAAGSAARGTPGKAFQGLVTAPTIPGTRGKPKLKPGSAIPRPSVLGPTTVKSPSRPGGTFGGHAPSKPRGGMIFLILVALLLLFLALVAAWSSLYLGGGGSETTGAVEEDLAVPGVEDEMLADMQDPEGMSDPLPEAEGMSEGLADAGALATETLPVNIGGDEPVEEIADLAAETPAPETVAPETIAPETIAATEPVLEPAPATAVTTEVSAAAPLPEDQDEIFLSAMDAPPPTLDALALPALLDSRDAIPDPPMPPPAPGTVYQFGADGLLRPTPEGIFSPDGVMLIAGKPPILPPSRSAGATAAALAVAAVSPPVSPAPEAGSTGGASAASLVTAGAAGLVTTAPSDLPETLPLPEPDPAMAGFRPRPRPETLVPEVDDGALLGATETTEFAGFRPLPRPASVTLAAEALRPTETTVAALGAQAASLTARAEADLAAAAALEAQNPSIVAISKRPAARPADDLSSAVEAAVAAAVRAPEPQPEVIETAAASPEDVDELDEPETASAAPSIPTKASVAKQATYANAINLSKIALIGTYGTDSRRYALIRQSNGKYKKVKIGDKIDGGTVKAITETEVRYQKGGRLISLKMPKI